MDLKASHPELREARDEAVLSQHAPSSAPIRG